MEPTVQYLQENNHSISIPKKIKMIPIDINKIYQFNNKCYTQNIQI